MGSYKKLISAMVSGGFIIFLAWFLSPYAHVVLNDAVCPFSTVSTTECVEMQTGNNAIHHLLAVSQFLGSFDVQRPHVFTNVFFVTTLFTSQFILLIGAFFTKPASPHSRQFYFSVDPPALFFLAVRYKSDI